MPEEADGAYAVLSLLGHSFGFDSLPLPGRNSDPAPLLDLRTAVDGVCQSPSVTPPVMLNLLSHCSPRVGRSALEPIARSLIRGDADADPSWLLECGYCAEPGTDPLGRRSIPALADDRAGVLTQEAQDTVISMTPTCTATTQIIGGVPALSLSTTTMSRQPFDEARAMTNPLFWPQCPPQSLFFKKMTLMEPGRAPLPAPDNGWSARILEVVDFSYGLSPGDEADMSTELDFVFFEDDTAAGCTYDLHRSDNREILVDRGFVMVEDLQSIGWRRTTTLKQVYFRTRANPGDVCQFWSLAHGMVSSSCSMPRQPV